jgi:hypothetical protein
MAFTSIDELNNIRGIRVNVSAIIIVLLDGLLGCYQLSNVASG